MTDEFNAPGDHHSTETKPSGYEARRELITILTSKEIKLGPEQKAAAAVEKWLIFNDVALNERTGKLEVNGETYSNNGFTGLANEIFIWADFEISPWKIERLLAHEAHKNSYDPLQRSLRAWKDSYKGGMPLEQAEGTFTGLAEALQDVSCTEQVRQRNTEYLKKFFLGLVGRILHPGIKFDNLLILTGPQGAGKSSFGRAIFPDYFEDSIDLTNKNQVKDNLQMLQRPAIVEFPEAERVFSGRSDSYFKQFLSTQSDYFRRPYGKTVEEHPRRCVCYGTTNHDEFLNDVTGSRRFMPIRCRPDLDLTWVKQNRDRLIEATFTLQRSGQKPYFTAEELANLPSIEEYEQADPLTEGLIRATGLLNDLEEKTALPDNSTYCLSTNQWAKLLGIEGASARRLGHRLTALGLEKRQLRVKGAADKRLRFYYDPQRGTDLVQLDTAVIANLAREI